MVTDTQALYFAVYSYVSRRISSAMSNNNDVKLTVGGKCKAGQNHTYIYIFFVSSCIHTTDIAKTSPRFRRVVQARLDASCSYVQYSSRTVLKGKLSNASGAQGFRFYVKA